MSAYGLGLVLWCAYGSSPSVPSSQIAVLDPLPTVMPVSDGVLASLAARPWVRSRHRSAVAPCVAVRLVPDHGEAV